MYSHAKQRLQKQATDLAQNFAARLDGQFEMVAQVARSTATFMETQPNLNRDQLYELLSANVDQNLLIYGAAIAFKPYAFRPDKKLFSPYVYRGDKGLESIDIGADSYDYTDARWEWFTRPKVLNHAIWTEPYMDEGAGNILMDTYAVPFYSNGKFRGIAAVDIQLDRLQRQAGIEQLHGQPFVIVSPSGKFISHPNPDFIMKKTIQGRAQQFGTPEYKRVSENMLKGKSGVGVISGIGLEGIPEQGLIWVSYAPIKSTGWSFSTAVPETEMTADIHTQLIRGIIAIIVLMSLIIICILLVSTHITRPITSLALAVSKLGQGDLSVKAGNIDSGDEIGQLATVFNKMVDELNRHIKEHTRDVAARESVENELRIAREIQFSLLPSTFPPFPERQEFDLHAVNEAARHVAGDFFDFFFVNENTLMIVIADVSGKGIPAAIVMAVTRTIVRNLADIGNSPARILEKTNKLLIESRTQPIYVTLFICCYDTDTGRLVYANAGHHPPFRIDAQANVCRFGEATGTIVGMLEEAVYEDCQENLDPHEYLVLYTDGITEARSPDGCFYGEKQFKKVISACATKSVCETCNFIINEVTTFQKGEITDDMTMLVLRRNI
ncbi:MAG: SpoIIE family protein phosphatase [Gammaproteobacteria bacterium]